jgi:negative regulator of flagellin synthesis FlgM
MKIEQATKPANAHPVKETRGTTAKKVEDASDDEVELSSLASQLAASGSELPFDAGRVAEIKQAIAGGKFSINAGAIADRLIVSARELLDSRHSS